MGIVPGKTLSRVTRERCGRQWVVKCVPLDPAVKFDDGYKDLLDLAFENECVYAFLREYRRPVYFIGPDVKGSPDEIINLFTWYYMRDTLNRVLKAGLDPEKIMGVVHNGHDDVRGDISVEIGHDYHYKEDFFAGICDLEVGHKSGKSPIAYPLIFNASLKQ